MLKLNDEKYHNFDKKRCLGGGAIAGIIIGCLLALIIITILIIAVLIIIEITKTVNNGIDDITSLSNNTISTAGSFLNNLTNWMNPKNY